MSWTVHLYNVSFLLVHEIRLAAPEPCISCSSFRRVSMRKLVELLFKAASWASQESGAPDSELSPIVHVVCWGSGPLRVVTHPKVSRPKFWINIAVGEEGGVTAKKAQG